MKKALLVIDVQKIYTEPTEELYVESSERIVNNINLIIDKFKKENNLIIYCFHRYYDNNFGRMFDFSGVAESPCFIAGSQGAETTTSLKIEENAIIIEKKQYDCFENTNLEDILKENDVSKLLICGFMTEYCCESSARTAHDKGYFVDFILDATGTPFLSADEISVISKVISGGFAVIKNTKDILSEK